MEVLLAYTAPTRYKGNWRARKKDEGKAMLEKHAKCLNGKKASDKEKGKLVQDLAELRAVQVNVAQTLAATRRAARRREQNFRADFGNVCAGEFVLTSRSP